MWIAHRRTFKVAALSLSPEWKRRRRRRKKEKQRASLRVSAGVCVWEYCDHYRFLPSHIAIRHICEHARSDELLSFEYALCTTTTTTSAERIHIIRRVHFEFISLSMEKEMKNDTFLWYLPTLQKCIPMWMLQQCQLEGEWGDCLITRAIGGPRSPEVTVNFDYWWRETEFELDSRPVAFSVPSDCGAIFSGHQNLNYFFPGPPFMRKFCSIKNIVIWGLQAQFALS